MDDLTELALEELTEVEELDDLELFGSEDFTELVADDFAELFTMEELTELAAFEDDLLLSAPPLLLLELLGACFTQRILST